MRILPPQPARPPGLRLPCSRCGQLVEVYEIPSGWLDAETYVGGCCLTPVREPVPFNEFPPGYGKPA